MPLARLSKKRREKTQIPHIRSEKGHITIGAMDTKRKIKEYYEQLCAHKSDNLDETDQFFEIQFVKAHKRRNRQFE